MTLIEFHKKGKHILYDQDIFATIDDVSFQSQTWAQRSAIVGFAEGRGTTFFVQHQGQDFVLRHYQRGGIIAKISNDWYIWAGLRFSRPWREWTLLIKMQALGLPVPKPASVLVERKGFFYQADIMMHRIAHTKTLVQVLEKEVLAQGYWIAMGSVIRRFHEAGIYHADLNANNILLDNGGRFYLIDFDRGRLRNPALKWQKENLSRLQRSLVKMLKKKEVFYFSELDWRSLLRGYGWSDIVDGKIK